MALSGIFAWNTEYMFTLLDLRSIIRIMDALGFVLNQL